MPRQTGAVRVRHRDQPPFRADHVGSLLRPPALLAARADAAAGRIKRGQLENKDDLKRRVEEASRHVPRDQICRSPQCGFSSTVEGNALTHEEQLAKLRLVVETAAEIWGEGP